WYGFCSSMGRAPVRGGDRRSARNRATGGRRRTPGTRPMTADPPRRGGGRTEVPCVIPTDDHPPRLRANDRDRPVGAGS
ncbi:MAG: hypothetical protein AVDCRST_MAG59-1007, partial [uncultured Thermomicrobiales bacterium]